MTTNRGARRVPTVLDEAVLVSGTLAYGFVLRQAIPQSWHVPVNAAAALASLAYARRAGADSASCGINPRDLGSGAGVGSATAVVICAGVTAASTPRRTRGLFADDRFAGHGSGRAAYETLVRIPAGTAFSEEVLFRGAMLGIMLRRHGPLAAVARTSLCFGAWHVLPALGSLRSSAVLGKGARGRVGAPVAVAGVVAVTAAAGAGFAALRLRSGSVLAPVLAHAALNATAYLAARRAGR